MPTLIEVTYFGQRLLSKTLEDCMTLTRDDIVQALAQAYSHDANSRKVLDVTLVQSMADEVMLVIDRLIGELTKKEDLPR